MSLIEIIQAKKKVSGKETMTGNSKHNDPEVENGWHAPGTDRRNVWLEFSKQGRVGDNLSEEKWVRLN